MLCNVLSGHSLYYITIYFDVHEKQRTVYKSIEHVITQGIIHYTEQEYHDILIKVCNCVGQLFTCVKRVIVCKVCTIYRNM